MTFDQWNQVGAWIEVIQTQLQLARDRQTKAEIEHQSVFAKAQRVAISVQQHAITQVKILNILSPPSSFPLPQPLSTPASVVLRKSREDV